jgi:ATP-dependent DNA ligase
VITRGKIRGWRIQLHKHGGSGAAFTKNGHAHSSRVRWMIDTLARLRGVRSFVLDGELVACDHNGLPDFYVLQFTPQSRRDRKADLASTMGQRAKDC